MKSPNLRLTAAVDTRQLIDLEYRRGRHSLQTTTIAYVMGLVASFRVANSETFAMNGLMLTHVDGLA